MTQLSLQQGLAKAQKYCAYQERCHQEVRDKLYSLKMHKEQVEAIIVELIQQDFLNEERFARVYAGGKFRIKKWGRRKIITELKKRKITDYCIKKGMEEIEESDYLLTLKQVLEKKQASMKVRNPFLRKKKVAEYCIGRGFEPELVWQTLGGK